MPTPSGGEMRVIQVDFFYFGVLFAVDQYVSIFITSVGEERESSLLKSYLEVGQRSASHAPDTITWSRVCELVANIIWKRRTSFPATSA